MYKKILLSIMLSASLLLGTSSPAFADVEYSSSEASVVGDAGEVESKEGVDGETASLPEEEDAASEESVSSDEENKVDVPDTADAETGVETQNTEENPNDPISESTVADSEAEEDQTHAAAGEALYGSGSPVTQAEFDSRLSSLRSAYPNYSTWTDWYDGGHQCWGFARLIADSVFGGDCNSEWGTVYSIDGVKAGDILQYGSTSGSGHTVFVTSVSGSTITFVDCNGSGNYSNGQKVRSCGVLWDNTISKTANMFGKYSFSYRLDSPGIISSPTAELTVERKFYNPGDTVTFTFGGKNTNGTYTLGIYKEFDRYHTINVNSYSYSIQLNEVASYSAYMTSYGVYGGYADSNWVDWQVLPLTAELNADKTQCLVNESVTLSFAGNNSNTFADQPVTLSVWCNDEFVVRSQSIAGHSYVVNCDKPGEYKAYMTAYGGGELADSNWVYWTVYPLTAELSADKTQCLVNESVTLSFAGNNSNTFADQPVTLSVWCNDEFAVHSQSIAGHSYVVNCDKPGEYKAYMTAYGGGELADSNWVYWTVVYPKDLEIVSLSDDFYGKTGTPASFHIEVEGSGTVTYQWQYRTAGSARWKTPSQSSAKTADYVFNLKPSYDNIEVRCIVSDESGTEMISETRKANVFAFTLQPKDATASEGEAVNFEVSAIGNNITYQWYYKRPNSTWKKATVSGSNTAVLTITAGTNNNGTSYRCVITDEAGNKINSAAGLLTLDNVLRITGISEDAYDVTGESVTFHIDAAGQGDLTYQWQYKLDGESNWRTPGQASSKTADYVFKLRPTYDNIEVRCIVKDASGNSVTSDVRKANVFAITGQPQDAELALGEHTTFAVEAVGKELTYQWYYMRPEGSWNKVTVAGYNTAALVITANSKNDGTSFQCRITDGLGNMLLSGVAKLTQS